MRETFYRYEEEEAILVESDLNAYAYSNRFGWLYSVFIKFDTTESESEALEDFLETKESLIIALEHDDRAKYVGSRMVDGWSELYFYAADSKGLDAITANILKSSNYVYETSVVRDSKWNFHHKNLTPNELELAHMQSEKIIYLLEEEGDVLHRPRLVEHYLSFDTPSQKERFITHLEGSSFSFKDEISSDEFANGIAVTKEHPVTKETLRQVVEELFAMVEEHGGYYEGWSTTLVDDEA